MPWRGLRLGVAGRAKNPCPGVPRRPRDAIHQPQPHRHPDDASLPLTVTSPPPATTQDGGAEARRPTAHVPGLAFRFGPTRTSASSSRIFPALGTSHPVSPLHGEHPVGLWLPLGTVSESQVTHGGQGWDPRIGTSGSAAPRFVVLTRALRAPAQGLLGNSEGRPILPPRRTRRSRVYTQLCVAKLGEKSIWAHYFGIMIF